MDEPDEGFPLWLEATMRSRGLSQAQLARDAGVAETQVSRWRRGLAVPTVQSLQRLAETLGVPRISLEQLAGYPGDRPGEVQATQRSDAEREAERQAYQAMLGQLLERRVPRELWQVYVSGCAALADALAGSFQQTLQRAEDELQSMPVHMHMPGDAEAEPTQAGEQMGFRTPTPSERPRSEGPGHSA